ncbi:MAG: type II secretion system protein GspG [Planctomycetota bacterium]|jgi:type II secretion system protein G
MSDSKNIIKTFVASALVAGFLLGASCSKAPDEKPADTLFAVEVKNFEFTVSQIDQYLRGIMPIPGGVQALLRRQLGGILGDPQLAGVNMGGDLRIVGVLLPDETGQAEPQSRVLIAGMLPVSDYDKLAANPKFGKPDKNGVSELTVSLGLPGMPAAPNAVPSGPVILIAKLNDKHALIGSKGQYDKFLAYKKLCSGGKDPLAGIPLGGDYPIAIYGDVQTASNAFGPVITEKLNEVKAQLGQAEAPDMAGGLETVRNVMDMYFSLLDTLMKEVKSFHLALKPDPDVLLIKETVVAVPGTGAAEMLVADPEAPEKNELMGYLKDGAAMNFAMKMNKPFWKELSISMMDLVGTLAGQNISQDDMAAIKKLITDSMDAVGDSLAGALFFETQAESPFVMDYIIAVEDTDKFNKMVDESMGLIETTNVLDLYKGLGIEMDFTLNRNVETYKDVSIDSAKLTMKSTEPNSPAGQMIEAMYGGGFDYRWGLVDGLCAIAIGGDVDAKVRGLIDLVKAGGPTEICSEVKDALKVLPEAEKADIFVTYNYVRLLGMVGKMSVVPGVQMPEINIPSKSNLIIAATIADGRAAIDIALPKQHLTELVTAFMMFQQEIMKQQGAITTKATMATLDAAIERFYIDTGRYPTGEEGLMALRNKPANADGWNGPYIKEYMPKDAWNRDFIYKLDADGKKFEIISYGADGEEGGEGQNADLTTAN